MTEDLALRIHIVTPAAEGSHKGNRIGAERWGRLLRELGHEVTVAVSQRVRDADVLIVLHARRCARAVHSFARAFPERPIVLVLTGTDLYVDLPKGNRQTRASIQAAHRLVVLQPHALDALPKGVVKRARVILQSVAAPRRPIAPRKRSFDICVVGHMRDVKDPMRAAMASRSLPQSSRIAVLHAGRALTVRYARRAEREMQRNARYTWLGGVTPAESRRLIQRSRALVISSRAEGGAHVVSEALVLGTPVIASDIAGNVGMLGEDYPALYPVGDTRALAELMRRVETDATLRARLDRRLARLAPAYTPKREREALRSLMRELLG